MEVSKRDVDRVLNTNLVGTFNLLKKCAENKHPFYEILGPFWGPFLSKKSVVCRSKNKCVLHVGAREAGYIKMGPKIDDVGS